MATIPVLKILIVGDGNVGKTSLVRRYCTGMFSTSRVTTIGVDFQTQVVRLPQGEVKLSIWDLAGQDRFQVMRPGFYKGGRAGALVYDVTDLDSFKDLGRWRQELIEVVPNQPMVVVGNKIDLPRVVAGEEARAFADSIRAPYIETSAATGEGVDALFDTIAKLAWATAALSGAGGPAKTA